MGSAKLVVPVTLALLRSGQTRCAKFTADLSRARLLTISFLHFPNFETGSREFDSFRVSRL